MYILDSNSFRVLQNYYPSTFQSFWDQFQAMVDAEQIRSVREVYRELQNYAMANHLLQWVDDNKGIFSSPTEAEMRLIEEILSVPHFQQLVGRRQQLAGTPVADPWIIASARFHSACVVTEEQAKPNAAKIPNVCEHFSVDCTNLEGLLQREGWQF